MRVMNKSIVYKRSRASTLPPNIGLELTGKGGVLYRSQTKCARSDVARFEIAIHATDNNLVINLNHGDRRRPRFPNNQEDKIISFFEQELEDKLGKGNIMSITTHPQGEEGAMHNSAYDGENQRSSKAHIHYKIIDTTQTRASVQKSLHAVYSALSFALKEELHEEDVKKLCSELLITVCLAVCKASDEAAARAIITESIIAYSVPEIPLSPF